MVAFISSPIDTLLHPATRARAPSRTCTAVPLQPFKSNPRCDLRETNLTMDTRWGSRSRDPIGYWGASFSVFGYLSNRPLYRTDPTGLKPATSDLPCPGPCKSKKPCEFEIDAITQVITEPPQSDDFIGPMPGVYVLTIALKFSPEVPEDEKDLQMTVLGPGACYGGFNRVKGKGSVEVVLRTGKKCTVNQGSFPPNYPHPTPPGEGGNLDQECYDVFFAENATDPGIDGANYHFRANLISSVKIDFCIETECFCGIGHCQVPGVRDEYYHKRATGTLCYQKTFIFGHQK